MRIERLGEKAVILRDLPCSAFELARWLNGTGDTGRGTEQRATGSGNSGSNHGVTVNTKSHSESAVPSPRSPLRRGESELLAFGIEEAVASYETVGVYFSEPPLNLDSLADAVSAQLASMTSTGSQEPKLHDIPVCYELGPDLQSAATTLEMSPDELIDIHLGTDYHCYAVGFSPGFAYLGYLDDRIGSLPRLTSPRPRVEPGSVGITGRQTAVYPSATPGGWNLIGKCPLTLVDVEDGYFPIEAGDQIRFVRVDHDEFSRLEGERL